MLLALATAAWFLAILFGVALSRAAARGDGPLRESVAEIRRLIREAPQAANEQRKELGRLSLPSGDRSGPALRSPSSSR